MNREIANKIIAVLIEPCGASNVTWREVDNGDEFTFDAPHGRQRITVTADFQKYVKEAIADGITNA